jgi:raffinose/stachyose/melibiose transport system permease protein
VLLAAIALAHLIPFYLLLCLTTKTPGAGGSMWVPQLAVHWENFSQAWTSARLGSGLANTAVITVSAMILACILGLCAAYPLARRATRLNGLTLGAIVACMMVPNLTILVPLYGFMVQIHGVNHRWAVIALHVTFNLPTIVFLYTGALRSIPRELDEAAAIDGAGIGRTLAFIIAPLLKPTTAAICVVVGISVWNDFNFSLFFLQDPDVRTVTVSMQSFFSQYTTYVERAAAGCLISSLPVVAVFLALQKFFVAGLASGAVKG